MLVLGYFRIKQLTFCTILIALVSGSPALWDNSLVFPQPCLSGGALEGTDHAFLRATNVVARNPATEITLGSQMWLVALATTSQPLGWCPAYELNRLS